MKNKTVVVIPRQLCGLDPGCSFTKKKTFRFKYFKDSIILSSNSFHLLRDGLGANPFSREHYGAADCIRVWAWPAKRDDGRFCLTAQFRGQQPTGKKR